MLAEPAALSVIAPRVISTDGATAEDAMKLEDVTPGAQITGISGDAPVTVVATTWIGGNALRLTYRTASQKLDERLLYRDHEPRLELAKRSAAYDLTADAATFKLAAEALRIRMAGRFDPMLAVHTSDLEPLPHQIQAVYGELIQRTPLRFLLADDPGAGKTIMAGLYIKELMLRGDLERCLIVAPGGLVEQWQDELREKFGLTFELLTRQLADAEPDGNVFARHNLLIARMDQLSRSDEFKEQLERADWDLVVVDEAHRMSAHYFGNELKKTKRYQLGELLGKTTRHFLLMTATPHAGREEDFQLFMALLDTDRFEGRYRDAVHTVNTDGLMRRMVKEDLKTFEGKPLFPERRAYTVAYELSEDEKILYDAVTEYVRDQMNLADRLRDAGDKKRGFTVGFALTVLQRRLASSPGGDPQVARTTPQAPGEAPQRDALRQQLGDRRRPRQAPARPARQGPHRGRPDRRGHHGQRRPAGRGGRGDRVRGRRRGHRRPHDRRARQGTRAPRRPDRARAAGKAQRHGQEVDRAPRAAHRQHDDHRREDHHLHRAPRHP